MTIGERIRAIRHARGKTLETVALDSRISLSYLSDIERGRTTPSIPMLVKLATVYGMTIQEFIAPIDEWRLPQ